LNKSGRFNNESEIIDSLAMKSRFLGQMSSFQTVMQWLVVVVGAHWLEQSV
jgi:hypothetical protein